MYIYIYIYIYTLFLIITVTKSMYVKRLKSLINAPMNREISTNLIYIMI